MVSVVAPLPGGSRNSLAAGLGRRPRRAPPRRRGLLRSSTTGRELHGECNVLHPAPQYHLLVRVCTVRLYRTQLLDAFGEQMHSHREQVRLRFTELSRLVVCIEAAHGIVQTDIDVSLRQHTTAHKGAFSAYMVCSQADAKVCSWG